MRRVGGRRVGVQLRERLLVRGGLRSSVQKSHVHRHHQAADGLPDGRSDGLPDGRSDARSHGLPDLRMPGPSDNPGQKQHELSSLVSERCLVQRGYWVLEHGRGDDHGKYV